MGIFLSQPIFSTSLVRRKSTGSKAIARKINFLLILFYLFTHSHCQLFLAFFLLVFAVHLLSDVLIVLTGVFYHKLHQWPKTHPRKLLKPPSDGYNRFRGHEGELCIVSH